MHKLLLVCGAAAISVAPAAAQPAGSRQTREFVQAAAQSDTFEILEGQTVLAQSTDPQVRGFASRMIEDHSRTSRDLQAAAQRAGLEPPPMALSTDQSQMLNALQSQRGPDFDKTYLRQQAMAHHAALVTEQKYAASGDDPAVRQVATAATPIIASHLSMAEQMQR